MPVSAIGRPHLKFEGACERLVIRPSGYSRVGGLLGPGQPISVCKPLPTSSWASACPAAGVPYSLAVTRAKPMR